MSSKPKIKTLLDTEVNDKTESEIMISLLTSINERLSELVKLSKDIDYKLWAKAKQDGLIK